jgi:type I restriction enzyme S subunit
LRQSILKAAFEGKLVPQDPDDEPAGELLKRIADERAQRERLAKEAKKAAKSAKMRGPKRRQNMSAVSAG